mmetsp:Transcript_27556/g.41691  ORF Transcript_27556/g.41691 Transcript_27556/m.41691 type:complete len:467 (-) Transcript_27556:8-1408(-)
MVTISGRRSIYDPRHRTIAIITAILMIMTFIVFSILQMAFDHHYRAQVFRTFASNSDIPKITSLKRPSVAFVICLHSAPKNPDGSLSIVNPKDQKSLNMAPTLAVLAASVRRIAEQSRYETHLVALVRRSIFVPELQQGLHDLGFDHLVPVDRLVEFEDMEEPGRTASQTNKIYFGETLVAEENDKLYIYNMTQYDRVVLLDTDVIMVKPIDELLDDPAESLGTLDYYALEPGKAHPEGGMKLSVLPPINAGFVVVRPNVNTLTNIQDMLRRGQFTTGQTKDGYVAGWEQTGIGYFFGGISIQGVLTAYYFKNAMKRSNATTRYAAVQAALHQPQHADNFYFREVDQCVYNVLGHDNCKGKEAGVQGTANCRNADCSPTINPSVEGVRKGLKVVHFTGSCLAARPWKLCTDRNMRVPREVAQNPLCQEFILQWMEAGFSFLASHKNAQQVAPTLPKCLATLTQGLK